MKRLLIVTAVIECATGFGLVAIPHVVVELLLGSPIESLASRLLLRLLGAALLTIGLTCWLAHEDAQSKSARGLTAAMLMYNIAAAGIFGYAGLALRMNGIGLWPAILVHVTMSVWCVTCLRHRVT